MKNIALIGFICMAVLLVGCAGPRFASEAQYDKGEWKGNAYLNEVAKIKRDKNQLAFDKEVGKMAIDKLKSQPADTKIVNDVIQGYKGIVQNLSNHKVVQISLRDKNNHEVKSYVFGPVDSPVNFAEDYLLPGDYCAIFIANGKQVGDVKKFTSGPRQFDYFGKKYHWFAYLPE